MPTGIAGDTPSNQPTIKQTDSVSNQIPGSQLPAAGNYIQGPNGLYDAMREDVPGRITTGDNDTLLQILIELKTITMVLAEGLNTTTDPDVYRTDPGVDIALN